LLKFLAAQGPGGKTPEKRKKVSEVSQPCGEIIRCFSDFSFVKTLDKMGKT
jgi:hypothetical protein